MANTLLLWLFGRFLDRRYQARSAKRRGPGPTVPRDHRARSATPAPSRPDADRSFRLVGGPHPHERVVLVPRDRIVLVLEHEQPTIVALPKTYLWPPIVPTRRPMTLMVVNTAVVGLVLRVRDLVTVDGYEISRVTVRVLVQVSESDGYGKLARTAAEAGAELEQRLLDQVERELGNEVRVAVRMNRLTHLRRLTVSEVLNLRGLPTHLAGGVLDLRAVNVTEVGWPEESPPAGTGEGRHDAEQPDEPARSEESLELTTDAKLRRLWLANSEVALDGIASAQAGGFSTVVAVPSRTPGLADLLAVKEALRRQLDDRTLTVVATPARSYTELVQGWFRQIDASPARLVAVRPTNHEGLRIVVDQALRSTDGSPEPQVGTPADREALRRLLPHSRIEFVAAEVAPSERLR